jgi:aryl-alcohol dehydrogenase-like predicted oxidoreductase
MQTFNIPDTDLELASGARLASPGLGTTNAGLKYDGKDADRLFDLFLDLGGNVIDTARVYNDWVPPEKGRSERVIGDWLKRSGKRKQVVLISKGGHPRLDSMHHSRLSQACMEEDLALSLKALGSDYIDLYFYHRDDESLSVGELIERMEGFRKAGHIRYYGCSNWSAERIAAANAYADAAGYRGFIANEALYNIGSAQMKPPSDDTLALMDEAMLAYHAAHPRCLAMPYSSLCNGFFNLLAVNEEKAKQSPYDTAGNRELFTKITQKAQESGKTITQILLDFFYEQDIPMLPLAAPTTEAHLREIMDA